jgi:hypothetical protein
LFFQEEPIKVKRFFVSCFDVTPDFASTFEFRKSDEKDVNPIVSMEAAFNREAMCGEFFIEFKYAVKDIDLIECLQNQEAKGVNVFTFPNDDGETASDAIVRVLTLQCKTGLQVARGKRPDKLNKRVDIKQKEAAKEEELANKEFGRKEAAAIKNSLEGVDVNVKEVKDVVHSCEVKLESQGVEFVEMKQEVKSHGVVMGDIKNGLCNVIPDYQIENKNLKAELKHQKWLCDVQESKTAAQTTKVNRLKVEVSSFHVREDASLKREEAYLKRIKELEDNLDVRKTIENARQVSQLAQEDRAFLKEELAFARSERAASRQSAMEHDEAVILEENEEEHAAKRQRV